MGLTKPTSPPPSDITASFINVDYNAGTGAFKANGFPVALDVDGSPPPDFSINSSLDTDWLIQLTLDTSGNPSGGALTIKGGIPSLSIPDGSTLLTGTLQTSKPGKGFGWLAGAGSDPDIFEFVFDTTGGVLVPAYYRTFPSRIDVILTAGDTPFNGSFATNFTSTGFAGVSDNFPEPGSFALAFVGASLLGVGPLRRFVRARRAARG